LLFSGEVPPKAEGIPCGGGADCRYSASPSSPARLQFHLRQRHQVSSRPAETPCAAHSGQDLSCLRPVPGLSAPFIRDLPSSESGDAYAITDEARMAQPAEGILSAGVPSSWQVSAPQHVEILVLLPVALAYLNQFGERHARDVRSNKFVLTKAGVTNRLAILRAKCGDIKRGA